MRINDKTAQTRVNFYTNIVSLAVNIIIALVYTPYLVDQLGVSAYGILPLALIINQYISVATGALTSSYTRFYSVALQKSDYEQASRVISTSMLAIGAIVICVLPIFIGVIIKIDNLFQIPEGLTASAQYLFIYTALSFIVSLLSSLLNVTLYAQNRLDLMNLLKIVRNVMKLVVVWILFEYINVNVAYVGLSGFLTECIVLAISAYLFLKTKPSEIKIRLNTFDKTILTAIIAMSAWVLVQQLGDTLLYRTDNLLFNLYLGPEASGRLGAISSLGSYVMVITNVVGSLFGPLILIAYSKENHKEVQSLAMTQSKIVGCLSAVLCGTIAGVSSPLLSLWLDSSFAVYDSWLIIKLLPLPFYAAGGILAFVYRAWNKVKFPAIMTVILGIIDIILILLFCSLFDFHQAKVILYISALFSIVQSYVLNIYCVNRIYSGVWKIGTGSFITILAVCLIAYIISKSFNCWWEIDTLWVLLSQMVLSALITLGILIFLIFKKHERKSLISIIK